MSYNEPQRRKGPSDEMMNEMARVIGLLNEEVSKCEDETNIKDHNGKEKYYLWFYADHGNREDGNVYYSWLVKACNSDEAFQKLINKNEFVDDSDSSRYDFIIFDDVD